MSTALQGHGFLSEESEFGFSGARFVVRSRKENLFADDEPAIRYAPATRKTSPPERSRQTRVLRRMNGFLMEIHGTEARVAFVENGQTIIYDLPSEQLRRSGIEVPNQPFQMDEIEVQTDGGLIVGYCFRPLAKASDAYIETLNFDEERNRKRDIIFKKFAKAKA